jgi:hypothetical protein
MFHHFPMIYSFASSPLTLRKVSADLNDVRSSTIQVRPKTLGTILAASILLRFGGMFLLILGHNWDG